MKEVVKKSMRIYGRGLTHSLTYVRTSWSRVFLEKRTVSQLVKKFSAFYGTLRLITAFTTARHLSLSEPVRSSS